MKTFKKWNKKHIQDNGPFCSDDYKSFCRAFKNFLKRSFPNAEITGFRANHYDTSGFITQNDHTVYISSNMDRYKGYIDFDDTGAHYGVLYRRAKNTKDYIGEGNYFCSMWDLIPEVQRLLEQ